MLALIVMIDFGQRTDSSGYFFTEGLDVRFTVGRGAYTAASRMVSESFDFGYGDINALTEEVALRPETAPLGVFMIFNKSPSAIIIKRESDISDARQLEGKRIIGDATDVALRTFDVFASKSRIDARKVTIIPDSIGWAGLLAALDSGRADAAFGYISTSTAAVETAGTGNATIKAKWTFHKGDKVADVSEATETIAATGPAVSAFHVSKPSGWPPGDYQVQIFLGDKSAGVKKFTVK